MLTFPTANELSLRRLLLVLEHCGGGLQFNERRRRTEGSVAGAGLSESEVAILSQQIYMFLSDDTPKRHTHTRGCFVR